MGDCLDKDNVIDINELAWTPEFTLRKLLEIADDIDGIAISLRMKDGSLGSAISVMRVETLTLLCKHLDLRLEHFMYTDSYECEELH